MTFVATPPSRPTIRQPAAEEYPGIADREVQFAHGILLAFRAFASEQVTQVRVNSLRYGGSLPWHLLETYLQDQPKVDATVRWAIVEAFHDAAGQAGSVAKAGETWSVIARDLETSAPVVTDMKVRQVARIAADITESSARGVQTVVQKFLDGVIDLEEAQRRIRQSGVGLSEGYAQAVERRRDDVAARLRRKHPTWKASTVEGRANAAAKRYAAELRRSRALTIARTETMRVINESKDEAWQQGVASGEIAQTAVKVWVTDLDACPQCEPFSGETVPVGESFSDGGPPLHPSCRCGVDLAKA